MTDLAFTLPANVSAPDPERGHRTWHLGQVFPGKGEPLDPSKKYYIPNPWDKVIDAPNQKEYIVEAIDINYKSTLTPWEPNRSPESQKGVLTGFGVGSINEAYRVYYNKRTVPNTLTICSYAYVVGKDVTGYRIFRGADTSERGEVISRHYDQSGHYLGDVIPVEAHYIDGEWKSVPKVCNVQDPILKHKDIVTAVFLNKDGIECSSALLNVMETNLTPALNRPLKEIKSIELESPFLDQNDKSLLRVPNNMPLQDIVVKGIVHYTTGEKKRFDFDQSEGQIFGLEGRVLSVPDLKYDLSATYYMEDSEFSPLAKSGAKRHISFPLFLTTYSPDNNNPVKLYVVPEWLGEMLGYRLNYWLYDLERNQPINVTSLVRYHKDFPFNGLIYGNTQKLVVDVDLSKVHPRYMPYVHVQDFEILLLGKPSNSTDSWRLMYAQGNGWYGEDIEARHSSDGNNSVLNIANGFDRWGQFSIAFYQKMGPLSDVNQGIYAPEPSHVEVFHNGVSKMLDPTNFHKDFTWPETLVNGATIELRWKLKVGPDYKSLSSTPMTVRGI